MIDLLDIIQTKGSCWNFTLLELSFSDGIVNRSDRILVSAALHAKDPDYQLKLRIMGKDSTLRRARTSLWWPGMNKQLKQFIDICEVYNAFQTKNQQFKSWVSYFFSGTLPGFSWRLRTCHRLAPGVGLLANQLQENMSGNPSQPLWNLLIFSRQIAEEEAAWPSG